MRADGSAGVLVADVGTSSLKAVRFARDGTPSGQAAIDYPTHAPAPGVREQDTGDWWAALAQAVHAIGAHDGLAALVLTGSMQNCIALGPDGVPRGRAILYSDAGQGEAARIAAEGLLPGDFARRTGNRPDGAMPILRFLSRDPRLAERAGVHFHFGAKDVLAERLTGRAAIDPTTATTTGFFNLAARRWDLELVAAAGLVPDQMPEVLPADAVLGPLVDEAAAALGLPGGLPVIVGAGDAGAACWGAGGSAAGRAHAYLGTTGWVACTLSLADAAPPRDTYTLAAPVGPAVIAIAPLLQAGSALDWLRGLAPEAAAPDALAALDRAPPAALFLPYLAGERSPFQDRDVRAAFLGLDASTSAGALAYAAREGLCHAIRDNLEAIGLQAITMPLIGGVAEDPLLRQLLADVLDIPVTVAPQPRLATAYGAFLLAAGALGWEPPALPPSLPTLPRATRRARAARRFSAYRHAQGAARAIAADLLAGPDDAPAQNALEDHA